MKGTMTLDCSMTKKQCCLHHWTLNINSTNYNWFTCLTVVYVCSSHTVLVHKALQGSQVGVVVITRASHLYNPGSTPGVRMWAEICPSLSESEGFSMGTPVFLPPWRCAPRSRMVRIAAARGAYKCFQFNLVELRCLCTLRRWWARVFLSFFLFHYNLKILSRCLWLPLVSSQQVLVLI